MSCWVGLIFFFCAFWVHDKQPSEKYKNNFGWLSACLVLVMSGAATGAVFTAFVGEDKVWVHGS
jgi:hypothetical protein